VSTVLVARVWVPVAVGTDLYSPLVNLSTRAAVQTKKEDLVGALSAVVNPLLTVSF
jgi:hypothetical protein